MANKIKGITEIDGGITGLDKTLKRVVETLNKPSQSFH